jgi:hypothetical protein
VATEEGITGMASAVLPYRRTAVGQPPSRTTPDPAEKQDRALLPAERQTVRLITVALVAVIATQRVLLPGGVPAVVPEMYLLTFLLWKRGLATPDTRRLLLYLGAITACTLAAVLSSFAWDADPSVTSIGLLVVTYLPLCWVVAGDTQRIFRAVLGRFVGVMTFFAVVAIVEWGAQVVGWTHQDLITNVFPSSWLYQNFNTNYPVQYGSSILKSNAFVFDEPSVLSQFLALGMLAQLTLGIRWVRMVLFGLALVATVSGTGVIVLVVGLAAIALSRGFKYALATLLLSALAVVLLALTPAGSLFGQRAGETSSSGSSGNLRFVQPYTRLYDISFDGPVVTALVGQGPGAGDRQAIRYQAETGLPLISPNVPKLIVEYGIPAMALFMWFIIYVFGARAPSIPFAIALFTFYAILQGALLLPLMPYACMLLSAMYPRPQQDSSPGQERMSRLPSAVSRVNG